MSDEVRTVREGPLARRADERDADDREVSAVASTHPALGAAPAPDPLELAVALSRTQAVLFGKQPTVKVGRYTLIERAGAGGMGVVWSAYDPELGRAVALKLASTREAASRTRARDEGRALARLSHPNVVPIYDVLETDDGVFLVMELVRGKSLREVAAEGATAHDLIRAYRQAGEGLAAAHGAGLIHRDFKPDNAVLGADARVRVLDFGLAHVIAAAGTAETVEIAGTPRYMAPEQRDGQPITAAVDQYALCASLREALGDRLPSWLAPTLERGTADRPEDRYASLGDLLRALALDPATRWRRRALAGTALLGIGAASVAFVVGRAHREEEPCAGAAEQLAPSWDTSRRTAIVGHLGGLTAPYAAEASRRVVAGLDAYATGWIDRSRMTCRAHRRGELSPAAFERREACLAHRRSSLTTLADLAAAETGPTLGNLVIAIGNLPDLGACGDDDALAVDAAPLLPLRAGDTRALETVAHALQVTLVEALLARADVERDAGRLDQAARDAGDAMARAESLQYRPLVARAHLTRGRVTLTAMRGDRGTADFIAAQRDAFAVGDEALAIEAYARAAYARATSTGDPAATDGIDVVEALAERPGSRFQFPRALLELNLGNVAMARGDRETARWRFEKSRAQAAAITGRGAGELTSAISGLMLTADDPAVAARYGAELVATRTKLYGEHHPETLGARVGAATARNDAAATELLASACRDLARYHPSLGSDLAECAYELIWAHLGTRDEARAREAAELVVQSRDESAFGAIANAYLLVIAGDRARAHAFLDELRAPDTSPWWDLMWAADAAVIDAIALPDAVRRTVLANARARYHAIARSLPRAVYGRRIATLAAYGLTGTAEDR